MPGITIHEFDILRGPEHDLSLPDAWDNLATLVVRPNTVFISSPPCATFSRSRHRKPGPPPLRTAEFPRGFPWLKDKFYLQVQNANFLVDNTLRLAAAAAQVGNAFFIEHPEDLGVAEDGTRPSSIWQWPEMLELIACQNSLSFAVFQCEYGADTSRPTRFVTNLSSFQKHAPPYAKLPWFSPEGRYRGPLPRHCPHPGAHGWLIGKDATTRAWRTSPSAAYPGKLCLFLAQHVVDSLRSAEGAPSSSTMRSGPASQGRPATFKPSLGSPALVDPPLGFSSAPVAPPIGFASEAGTAEPSRGSPALVVPPLGFSPAPVAPPLGLGFSSTGSDEKPSRGLPALVVPPLGFSPVSPAEKTLSSRPLVSPSLGFSPAGPAEKSTEGPLAPASTNEKSSEGPLAPEFPSPRFSSPRMPRPGPLGFSSPVVLASKPESESQPHLLWPFPDEEAEEFARRLTAKPSPVVADEIVELFKLLPKEKPPRGEEQDDGSSSFSTGSYCKGGLVGLRTNTRDRPLATEAMARFARQTQPGFVFTTLSVFQGVKTPMHKDSRNAPYPNLVIPLTRFKDGQIWVQDPSGSVPEYTPEGLKMGRDLEVSEGPVTLDAYDAYHFTRAWKGERIVMVAYVTDRLDRTAESERALLRERGFVLPDMKEGNSETSEAAGLRAPVAPDAACGTFRPEACGNRGLPLSVTWEGKSTDFVDGFGLCSPTRWRPSDRGGRLSAPARNLARQLHHLARDFVRWYVQDPPALCRDLAEGKLLESPFSGDSLHGLRQQWCRLVGGADWKHLLEVPPGQPFLLRAIGRTAELLGDPDWEILTEGSDNYCNGVPVGFEEDIPHLPQVFERKSKHRKFDDDLPEWDRPNYSSARLNAEQLLARFREEEELGRMQSTTLGALKDAYPSDRIRVASMAAIQKPDGSVRPVHDATHGVHVNQSIPQHNLLAVPSPAEIAWVVGQSHEQHEQPFAITGDVATAHRLVKIREKDWGLLACRASDDSTTVFINKVGTFGVSSASLWWARLFGLIGRSVGHSMLNHALYQLVFVDDLHANFYGPYKHTLALTWLVLYLMMGTPFAWKKFKGGARVAFIGYELDYEACQIGLSGARGAWLVAWIRDAKASGFVVQTRRFAEFLGRLGFVSRVLYWLKAHMSPLYAWAAAMHRCGVGKLPDTVILTLMYIEECFAEMEYKVSPLKIDRSDQPLFFTDAKCEDHRVVLGGWETGPRARWFSVEVFPAEAPYLFDAAGKSQWASASAELLASFAALWAFGHLEPGPRVRKIPVAVSGITDNRSNQSLAVKQSSTKWPLMIINMQVSHHLMRAGLRLSLTWRPREENTLADDLTNGRFDSLS